MIRLDIKPLSVNQAWQGRRFKSKAYKAYESHVQSLLRSQRCHLSDMGGKLALRLTVGLSSRNADLDNVIKQLQDVVCSYFEINDKRIYQIYAEKIDVKKGEEFIEIELENI